MGQVEQYGLLADGLRRDPSTRRGYRRGASDARLITRVKRDPVMGGTGMNVNFVTMYRAPSRGKEA